MNNFANDPELREKCEKIYRMIEMISFSDPVDHIEQAKEFCRDEDIRFSDFTDYVKYREKYEG